MNRSNQHRRISAAAEFLPRLRRQRRTTVAGTSVPGCFGQRSLGNKVTVPATPLGVRSDYGLIAAGITAAIGSVAFAAFMISEGSSLETVKKGEFAGFFARGLPAKSYKSPVPTNKFDNRPIGYRTIDYDATGSISMRDVGVAAQKIPPAFAVDGSSASASTGTSNTYVLRFVYRETALLQSNRDFYVVRRGTMLPGAERVLTIERRGNSWILATATRTFTQVIKNVPLLKRNQLTFRKSG